MRRAVGLFLATLVSVYWTYGVFWSGEEGLWTGGPAARESAVFAGALMAILLAHELGHFFVARRHGFSLSLPYFIPFPAGFGTFGAIIRLRSLPTNRTALLEMGAAGPLAGMVVAVICLAVGLPATEAGPPVMPPLPEVGPPPEGWLAALITVLDVVLSWGPIGWLLDQLSPPVPEGHLPVLIFNNPPIMDLLGTWILGEAPGRYDTLGPLALAGWVGCFLTALNLVPVGQLDGGHVLNALFPRQAPRVSRVVLGLVLCGGLLWGGWLFWGGLLWVMGAWRSLEVPWAPPLSRRALAVALVTGVVFLLTFRATPLELDSLPAGPAEVSEEPGSAPAASPG